MVTPVDLTLKEIQMKSALFKEKIRLNALYHLLLILTSEMIDPHDATNSGSWSSFYDVICTLMNEKVKKITQKALTDDPKYNENLSISLS